MYDVSKGSGMIVAGAMMIFAAGMVVGKADIWNAYTRALVWFNGVGGILLIGAGINEFRKNHK